MKLCKGKRSIYADLKRVFATEVDRRTEHSEWDIYDKTGG